MRDIRRGERFGKCLKSLARKHKSAPEDVERALSQCAENGPPARADQIRNLGGLPVFKQRLRLGDKGTRGGARLIYYCDEECVVALFLYSKSDQEDIAVKELRDALAAAGLLPDNTDS